MFKLGTQGGVLDGWVERWRHFRKIDTWPLVSAKVLGNTRVVDSGPEGDTYHHELILQYGSMSSETQEPEFTYVKLNADPLSVPSYAEKGDTLLLRIHPSKPEKAIFEDTSNSAGRLPFLLVFGAIFFFIGLSQLLEWLYHRR